MSSGYHLTRELAKALGLPKHTTRAVLTLQAGEPPRMQLTVNVTDSAGNPILEQVPGKYGEGIARRIAQVQFMVRLEQFPDQVGKP